MHLRDLPLYFQLLPVIVFSPFAPHCFFSCQTGFPHVFKCVALHVFSALAQSSIFSDCPSQYFQHLPKPVFSALASLDCLWVWVLCAPLVFSALRLFFQRSTLWPALYFQLFAFAHSCIFSALPKELCICSNAIILF